MEFKEKLKMLRREKGLSQQQLADRIFVSRSAVAKWENGLGYPSEDSYDALTAYFGVDKSYFHTEEPETVIVTKNRRIRLLRYIAALAAVAAAIAAIIVGFHWFSSVPKDSIQEIAHLAAAYLGYGELDVVKVSQRGDYLAALCEDGSGNWCMCEPDSCDINSYPLPLDSQRQPVIPEIS